MPSSEWPSLWLQTGTKARDRTPPAHVSCSSPPPAPPALLSLPPPRPADSYLAIQGPPGTGKTTLGAEMIVDRLVSGRRVGVTGTRHKVIGNLLDAVSR